MKMMMPVRKAVKKDLKKMHYRCIEWCGSLRVFEPRRHEVSQRIFFALFASLAPLREIPVEPQRHRDTKLDKACCALLLNYPCC